MSFSLSRVGVNFGAALVSTCLVSCATVAQVTNLSSMNCAAQMRHGLSDILGDQGETIEASESLAQRTVAALTQGARGPRPFQVVAPSGTDYVFFVDKKTGGCLLRLHGRRHGFVSYTNNLTYIATRPLSDCECAE